MGRATLELSVYFLALSAEHYIQLINQMSIYTYTMLYYFSQF
jgi:hypothetical protein